MDAKLQEIMLDYGLEGYGLYWYCIELIAQNVNGDNLTFELEHDARIIARNTGSTPQKVSQMMTSFINLGLLDADNGHIFCLKLASRCDDFTAKAVRRKGVKSLSNQSVGVSPTNSEKVPLEVEVRSKKKEEEKEAKQITSDSRFNEFYDLYGKKVGGKKVEVKFNKLSKKVIDKIFEALPGYIASTPDKKFRKAPLAWLNGEHWNDEIEINENIDAGINFDLLVSDFNEAMKDHENVPVAIKVTVSQQQALNKIAIEHGMTNDRYKSYFNHCANSESFSFMVNGVNIPAQGIGYFLKEETLIKAMG